MTEIDLVARLACAAVLGAAIGFERELRGHAAGVKTHALVAVGAALFTVAGAYGFGDIQTGPNVDPARIAAQVATGIGFIGAGAILKLGASVRGLTTAATLWLAAAEGVALGAGAWIEAIAGAVCVFLVLVGFRWVAPWVLERIGSPTRVIEVEYERGHGTLGPLIRSLERVNGRLGPVHLDDESADDGSGRRRATVEIATREREELDRVVDDLLARREVVAAAWRDRGNGGRPARGTRGGRAGAMPGG
jgi:putative Mg2+ transporter-C (MgtC) family protein